MTKTNKVHNHGPDEGRGMDCIETRLPSGRLAGLCMIEQEPRRSELYRLTTSGVRADYVMGVYVPASILAARGEAFDDWISAERRSARADGYRSGIEAARNGVAR